VWKDAIGQVFLSTLLSWGGLVTWSSYNRFYNKYYFDAAVIISIVPILSVLSAVTMFGVIGYLSTAYGVTPSNALQGAGGAIAPIVAYSEALTHMWGNTLVWNIVVFVTLFLSSTSSIVSMCYCFKCVEKMRRYHNILSRSGLGWVVVVSVVVVRFHCPSRLYP